MLTKIMMPALSPTMEEGKLVKWHVGEGDAVRAGDVIAEIETDKATMEVEAVDDGQIDKLLVAEGTEHVPVNEPIALLLADGEAAGTRATSTLPPSPSQSRRPISAKWLRSWRRRRPGQPSPRRSRSPKQRCPRVPQWSP